MTILTESQFDQTKDRFGGLARVENAKLLFLISTFSVVRDDGVDER